MANEKLVPPQRAVITPDRGPATDPNPGERSTAADASGPPAESLALLPLRGTRAGGGAQIDIGAQVGIRRNLEFTAGGRAQRFITGTFSYSRPAYDPKTGELHTSSASDSGESTLGAQSPTGKENAMTPKVQGGGDVNDTTTSDASGDSAPDRRRDKRTS